MNTSFKPALALLKLLLFLLCVPTLFAQPGMIDSNYLANANGAVRSIALQPDGKLLISGEFQLVNGSPRHCVARLNSDGALDDQFEQAFDWGYAQKIRLQSDGRIIVGGSFQQAGTYLPA